MLTEMPTVDKHRVAPEKAIYNAICYNEICEHVYNITIVQIRGPQ